jgi:glycosyltransferase involved in cell wall biosynthesis
MPRVSVIIPTSNRRALALREQAIDSVLAQTYTDYESSIVDVWIVKG